MGSHDPMPLEIDTAGWEEPAVVPLLEMSAASDTRQFEQTCFLHESSPLGRILVIDDYKDLRDCIVRLLSRAGFTADTASNGEEGWSALCSASYDLVITDHEMPLLSGLNLIRRMRETSAEPPCILISSDLPDEKAALNQQIEPGAVLEKPFQAEALIEMVYSLLLRGTS